MSKCFRVRLIKATNLVGVDKGGTSDPYVKIKTKKHVHKSRHIKKNLNPEWEEEFEVEVELDESIQFSVFDHDMIGSDDPIGDVSVPFSSLGDVNQEGKEIIKEFTLENADHGQLFVGFTPIEAVHKSSRGLFGRSYSTASSKVHQSSVVKEGSHSNLVRIRIIAGYGLAAKDRGGTSDPFVKIKSLDAKTIKTRVIEKDLNPHWNESFLVDFDDYVDLQVFDKDMVGEDEIGSVRVTYDQIKDIFEDKTKEKVIKFDLSNQGGVLEAGFTASGNRVPKSGLLLSALGGREKIILEKNPLALLTGAMFVSFVLGFIGWIGTIVFIAAVGGYIFLWKKAHNQKGKQEYIEKEAKLWNDHYKLYPNLESVEWLNKTLANIYVRHGEAMGTFMANTINPIIDQYKPGFLKSISIDRFNFGVKAPVLDSFRVDTRDNDKLIFFCNVAYYSDMNILVTVNTGIVNVPIIIEKIEVYAKSRVVVEWVDQIPYAGKLLISVMEKPIIDFQVRPLKGMDLTGVPGLSPWINDMINNMVINGMLLYPNKLEINIAQPPTPAPSATTATATPATPPAVPATQAQIPTSISTPSPSEK